MSGPTDQPLTEHQLATLASLLHSGSRAASEALANWLDRPSVVSIDSVDNVSLDQATTVLGPSDSPICFCSMAIGGFLSGEIILAFEEDEALALAGRLVDDPQQEPGGWNELTISAVRETTNIVGCAYLNALFAAFSAVSGNAEMIPEAPVFRRDFAASLLQFAIMDQASHFESVILAKTTFQIDATSVDWTLLLVPDAESTTSLPELLSRVEPEQ